MQSHSSNTTGTMRRTISTSIVTPEKLILFNFGLLLAFAMFGTGPAWEKSADAYEQESSNFVNQAIFGFLFISSFIALFPNFNELFSFIKREKYLSIFVTFSLVSALWSDYSIISLKRSFQLLVTSLVVMMAVVFIDNFKILKAIRIIVTAYIAATIFSVLLFSEATDPAFNTWRGLTYQKNGLAQLALICFLFSLLFYSIDRSVISKYWNYSVTALSILIIFMANSSTIIIIFGLIVVVSVILKIENSFRALRMRRFFFITVLTSILIFAFVLSLFSTEVFSIITDIFEKDLTFTGRTIFWSYLTGEIMNKPVLGYGFGTYWIMGSEHIYRLFVAESLVMNTSHNGFIDLTLQLGLAGLTIFVFTVGSYFKKALSLHNNIAILALIAILVSNVTETTFLGTRIITITYFYFYLSVTFSYLNFNQQRISNQGSTDVAY